VFVKINSSDSFFEGLDVDQLSQIETLLDTAIAQEEQTKQAKQIREIVPIEVWLNSTFYLGDWAKDLYKYWKEKIIEHVYTGSPEIILTGSIGTGKSTAAYVIILRKIYELSCYDHPQRLFGLSDRSHIFFVYLSITHRHAMLSGFGQMREMVDSIPYFLQNYKRDYHIDSVIRFPGRVSVIPGTDNLSVISLNLFGCIQDEADFKRRGNTSNHGDVERAHKIYSEITDRRISRFMDHGYDPGVSAIISSSTFESTFVSQKFRNAHKTGSTAISSTLYETKPQKYSKEKFCVFKGTEHYEAFIVNDLQDIIDLAPSNIQILIRKEALNSKLQETSLYQYVLDKVPNKFSSNFLFIPVDFKKSFENDIYGALNNISGVTIVRSGKLFSSKAVWRSNIDPELKHPFTRQVVELSVTGMDSLMNFFIPSVLFTEVKDDKKNFIKWKLKRHPGAKRFVHIDQSTSKDSTGLGITHLSGYVEDEDTLLRVPIVELDLALKIIPTKSGKKISIAKQISIAKIRKFLFQLISMGMPICKVTYDQFASADSIQIFVRKGVDADRQSVDRDDSQYTQFVDILTEHRFTMYDYPIFEKEFFNLEHDVEKRKVDHPDKNDDGTDGTKDVSDAIVGSTHLSLNDSKIVMSTPEEILETYKITTKDETREVKFNRMLIAGYDKVKQGAELTGFIGEEYGAHFFGK
jgi:hypothetical protein